MPILGGIYLFNVFVLGFIVFSLERMAGTCMEYSDVLWMMMVTITNLGYGEFTPSFWLSRAIIGFLSLFGIVQTALIVQGIDIELYVSVEIRSLDKSKKYFLEKFRLFKFKRNFS